MFGNRGYFSSAKPNRVPTMTDDTNTPFVSGFRRVGTSCAVRPITFAQRNSQVSINKEFSLKEK